MTLKKFKNEKKITRKKGNLLDKLKKKERTEPQREEIWFCR